METGSPCETGAFILNNEADSIIGECNVLFSANK